MVKPARPILNDGLLTTRRELVVELRDDFDLKSVFPEPSCELPNMLAGGGSAGVKDRADGGGPAGVVDGLEAKVSFIPS